MLSNHGHARYESRRPGTPSRCRARQTLAGGWRQAVDRDHCPRSGPRVLRPCRASSTCTTRWPDGHDHPVAARDQQIEHRNRQMGLAHVNDLPDPGQLDVAHPRALSNDLTTCNSARMQASPRDACPFSQPPYDCPAGLLKVDATREKTTSRTVTEVSGSRRSGRLAAAMPKLLDRATGVAEAGRMRCFDLVAAMCSDGRERRACRRSRPARDELPPSVHASTDVPGPDAARPAMQAIDAANDRRVRARDSARPAEMW